MAPMSTHNVLATPPTKSSFKGRTTGVTRQFAIASFVSALPGTIGHASSQIGNMRSTSARASAAVTPGASRASTPKLKLLIVSAAGSSRTAMITSGCGVIEESETLRHDADHLPLPVPGIAAAITR